MGYNANKSTAPIHPANDAGASTAAQSGGVQGDGRVDDPVGHVINCPYCGSADTELFSLFGSQLLTVQYYCNNCHTPFERVKDDDVLDDYAARKESQP